jgi:sec-independent protein translocase protein TatA
MACGASTVLATACLACVWHCAVPQSAASLRFGFCHLVSYSGMSQPSEWTMLRNLGLGELLVILVIVMLLFGSKKLPELADGMGKAIRNFKRGMNAEDTDVTPPTDNKQVPPHSGASDLKSEARDVKDVTPAERKS